MKRIHHVSFIVLLTALLVACVPAPTPTAPSATAPTVPDSVATAQAEISFPLLVPAEGTLPAGLTLTAVQVLPASGADALVMQYSGGTQHLDVQQSELPAGATLQAPTGMPSTAITVRGRPGYQVSSAPDLNAVLWEEDGRMVSLSGNLPPADLLAIAEQMQSLPAQSP